MSSNEHLKNNHTLMDETGLRHLCSGHVSKANGHERRHFDNGLPLERKALAADQISK